MTQRNKKLAAGGLAALALVLVVGVVAAANGILPFAHQADDELPLASQAGGDSISTGSSLSRVNLYSSIGELSDDSDAIVAGTVTSQEATHDIDDVTSFILATVEVSSVEKGDVQEGSTIIVRQTGQAEDSLLEDGGTYLLYIVTSGLKGDLADQYYVTGATAGIYREITANTRSSASDSFVRVDTDSGDELPENLTSREVKEAV